MDNSILPYNTKECTLCHRAYPATSEYFHRDRRGKYGFVARCKLCLAEVQRKYLRTQSGKETRKRYKQSDKGRAAAKRYRSGDSGRNAAKIRLIDEDVRRRRRIAKSKYDRTAKGKEIAARNRQKFRSSPEGKRKTQEYIRSQNYKQSAAKYRQGEQGRLIRKGINSRYRTAKTTAGGTYTAEQFKHLCEYYENICVCCGAAGMPLEADHVIPVSGGGSSDIENIQPLCRSCNASKHDKAIDYRYKGLPDDI